MNINRYSRTYILLFFVLTFATGISQEQELYRSFDGTGNNLIDGDRGASGAEIRYLTARTFSDGIGSPNGTDRPNPRTISNELFTQEDAIYDEHQLTDYIWVFGQFLDHDITLIRVNPTEPAFIEVPICDAVFDPNCTGESKIVMMRSQIKEGTGLSADNARSYENAVTAFIDGSAIYGSDAARASWLRSYSKGKLKVSKGNYLPFNTLDGEINGPTDGEAPHMDRNSLADDRRWFVAGDARANENIMLTAMHTLFVREHNRLCDELARVHVSQDDEFLYHESRKLMGAMLQKIVYEEWLPAMGVILEPYRQYQTQLDPNVSNVFTASAYRFGHTLLSEDLLRMDDGCSTIPSGDMTLREAFFDPTLVIESGIDPLFKGMSAQIQQALDCKMIDDVRNFLFGSPSSGLGMDLAAINIQRGRERGLPDYNAIRDELGIGRVRSFEEICVVPEEAEILRNLYHDVDSVDPWVGMLAEQHLPDAMFGESIMTVMKEQFKALREGDRFFYQSEGYLSLEERELVASSSLAKIIRRNTNLQTIQDDVFRMNRICKVNVVDDQHLSLAVGPNPIVDNYQLTIFAFDQGPAEVHITDMLGRVVQRESLQITRGSNNIAMRFSEAAPRGVYSLSVRMGEYENTTKVVRTY
ncbi:MAG: T9SS type A sorting domain-containing protein [Saprospiraceae bacterium]|nr:T9SS type A sorting domain-containing protein [Saprospiraceae bacterium]